MTESNPVRDAVRYALTAGVAASFVGAPAATLAQDDVAVQEKVTVTGSRIKRVDIEGPAPITVISREDIDATGDISVAEVLRGASFNSFGSFKQRSGSSAQSQNFVSLRGLGGQRTLVLLDGRRVTGAPNGFGGAGTNLSTIPLAAVERIEVLRDGASAIYGSDAVGGVINIIMRKDFEGMHLSYGISRPTQTGGDEDSASIVGGVSGAKGNITFGFDWQQKEIIFLGDRSFSATGLSSFGFPGSYFGFLTTDDPRNPAMEFSEDTDDDGVSDSTLVPAFLSVGTFADPRCPTTLGTSEQYPASVRVALTEPEARCRYNYAGVSANEAESDTHSFFINANYDITETTTFFTRGTFSFNESFGRYAPTPFTPPFPEISQDSPLNPTQPGATSAQTGDQFLGQSVEADTDGDGTGDTTVQGPFDVTFFYRNVPGGFRDTFIEDVLIDYMAGVQGTMDFLGGMDWEVGAQWSQATSNADNPGLALAPNLQASINAEEFDPFAVVSPDSPGQRAQQQAAALTGTQNNKTRIASFDAQVSFDAFQMNNGPVPVALGMEYRDELYSQEYDEQSNAGNIQGSSGGQDVTGARVVKSLFAETTIPVLSMLDINLAGRYDDYNDFGTTVNPKVSAAFRPLDTLLLRGSWGEGYRAPAMSELYSGASQSFNNGIDSRSCANDALYGNPSTGRLQDGIDEDDVPAGNPCLSTQYQNFQGGNRDLAAEESTSWNVGLVWNPLDDMSISLDWFDIEIEEEIGRSSMQAIFDEEFALDSSDPTAGTVGRVARQAGGRVLALDRKNSNIAKRETDGLDVDAQYGFSFGGIGDFRLTAQWTYVNEYERDEGDADGLDDPDFFDPELRGTTGLNWALGDFNANVIWNYLSSTSVESLDYYLDDYQTVDVSVGYSTPWNGLVTVGARNVFDEDPPTSVNITSPYYSNYLHDVYGRVPYVRYEQDL
jgi:iron complex outermembrane receptor protein